VDGRSSTSKSYVIRLLSTRLDFIARSAGKPLIVVRATPTRVVVNSINGSTVYLLL
ncbi:hypothetical protein QBC39DRAFT_256466, partial [Podospora conica]